MNKFHFSMLFWALSCLNIDVAGAGILSFDNVTVDAEAVIDNGYGELNWSNFWVQNPVLSQVPDYDSGYYNGVVSGEYTAFNADGGAAEISSAAPFNFDSAYFAAAYLWALDITATGFRNGSQVFQQQFSVNTDVAELVSLNFTGIDRLEFVANGGEAYVGAGYQFTMDNANISTAPVPVPAAFWLFGSALAGFIGLKRRNVC